VFVGVDVAIAGIGGIVLPEQATVAAAKRTMSATEAILCMCPQVLSTLISDDEPPNGAADKTLAPAHEA
jgi:hypothetical protein